MMRQDAHVQHVRVGDQDASLFANSPPLSGRCVTVVGSDRNLLFGLHSAQQRLQGSCLILR